MTVLEPSLDPLDPLDAPPAPLPPPVPELTVENEDEGYARLVAEPLDPGYGTTLGNALRRILLSSLEGAAITSVRIDQVHHEFSIIEGMQEDCTEFLLNVKEIRLKALSDRPGTLTLDAEGPGEITAGDLQVPADFEIVNPTLHLATLDGPEARINAEFHAQLKRGYVPATEVEDMPIGVIPVDAVFSPVRKVNFHVEKVRVGQATDFDRMILEVWTDGTVAPVEAVGQAARILIDQFALFNTMGGESVPVPTTRPPATSLPISPERYHTPIEALQLSVRTYNCLRRSGLMTIGQVLEHSEDELLALRNFGHKSYDELRGRLIEMNYIDGAASGLQILPDFAAPSDAPPPASSDLLDEDDDEESLGALGKALREALREVGDDDLLGADDEE